MRDAIFRLSGPAVDPTPFLSCLPAGFDKLGPSAQLPILERNLKVFGPARLTEYERNMIDRLLVDVWDAHMGEQLAGWAERLLGELHELSEGTTE
ncbi:hypothetical protein AAG614_01290 [Citromicrobium bathyomarinum]